MPVFLYNAPFNSTQLFLELARVRRIDDIVNMVVEVTGKKCNLCHNKVFNIVHSKNPDFSMDDMRKSKVCSACHDGDTVFSVEDNCDTRHDM